MVLAVIKQSRARIALVSAVSAIAGAANIWLLALINRNAHMASTKLSAVGEFAVALFTMIIISFVSQILLSRLSARTFYRLREQLVEGITRLTAQRVDAIGRHRLYTALTKDVPAVHDLIIVLPNYVFNFTVVAASLVYLCIVSSTLFLIFGAFLVVAICVAKFAIADRAEKRFQMRRQIEDELFKCYEAVIDGSKELKLNRRREDEFVRGDLQHHAKQYRDATVSAELFWNMSNNWSTAVIFIGVGALLFLSSYLGVTNKLLVSAFVLVIFYMVGPLTILMNSFRTIHAAKVGLARLEELQLDTSPKQQATRAPTIEPFRSLSVRSLSFEYDNLEDGIGFHVGPLDLDLSRGEIVYFVGGNGSGKTTAAKLLTGLYGRQSGSIVLNGIAVVDREPYFQRFSAVFQDYYLFETLVPKNGLNADPAEIFTWVEKLKLTEKVTVENGRLSTTKLSYGQRKRLALLVAYFDNSDIYVFDEWAADQDQEFREFFYRVFLPELKQLGKTAIVVSHDERYFHLADKVVKFEGGKIVSVVDNLESRMQPTAVSAMLGV